MEVVFSELCAMFILDEYSVAEGESGRASLLLYINRSPADCTHRNLKINLN